MNRKQLAAAALFPKSLNAEVRAEMDITRKSLWEFGRRNLGGITLVSDEMIEHAGSVGFTVTKSFINLGHQWFKRTGSMSDVKIALAAGATELVRRPGYNNFHTKIKGINRVICPEDFMISLLSGLGLQGLTMFSEDEASLIRTEIEFISFGPDEEVPGGYFVTGIGYNYKAAMLVFREYVNSVRTSIKVQ